MPYLQVFATKIALLNYKTKTQCLALILSVQDKINQLIANLFYWYAICFIDSQPVLSSLWVNDHLRQNQTKAKQYVYIVAKTYLCYIYNWESWETSRSDGPRTCDTRSKVEAHQGEEEEKVVHRRPQPETNSGVLMQVILSGWVTIGARNRQRPNSTCSVHPVRGLFPLSRSIGGGEGGSLSSTAGDKLRGTFNLMPAPVHHSR